MSGIYIHIPFCKQACHYCNFHFSTSLRYKNEFVSALLKEIELTDNNLGPANTVYFGGGTPSLLTIPELEQVLDAVRQRFGWHANAEITLEANPDDFNSAQLDSWKDLGINRLSIGVQSFFEEDLRWMNRAHNAEQAIESLQLAVATIPNITLDLIYGSPGLSDEKWKHNLDQALNLGVKHLSCYALTVEPLTPLAKMIRTQQSPNVDDGQQARQFLFLIQYLAEKGFEQYEISNFCLPGHRSRHNSAYWQGKPYIGLGPGAHSFDGNSRWWNIANNQRYIRSINEGQIPREKETLTPVQRWNEYIMIRLRTAEGIDLVNLPDLPDDPGLSQRVDRFKKNIQAFIQKGWVAENNMVYSLTDEGKLYADGIAGEMFER
ncbi:MAG: radical SAM family heme chaperone HemW [Chitinophagaceae bacterium]